MIKEEIKTKLKEEYENHTRLVEDCFKTIDSLMVEITSLKSNKEILISEIDSLNLIKEGISSSSVELQKVNDEIVSAHKLLTSELIKLSDTNKYIIEAQLTAKAIIDEANKIKLDFETSIKDESDRLDRLRAFVESEDKRLTTKDNDLKVIENRWKKLYAEKNLSFMM